MLTSNQWAAFPKEYYEIYRHFNDDNGTLRQWCNMMERQAYALDKEGVFKDIDEKVKFKGNMFEVFAELFFKTQEINSFFGLVDYTPCKRDVDYGVDGVGINSNGDKTVVQVKYRKCPSHIIPYADLARTYSDGIINYDLAPNKIGTVMIFTNASDVSWQAKNVFAKRLVVVSKEHIQKAIDNNKMFWKKSFAIMDETIQALIMA